MKVLIRALVFFLFVLILSSCRDGSTIDIFNFLTNGTISVQEGANIFNGTWSSSGSGNDLKVIIDLPALPDFNDTWDLHNITEAQGASESKVDLRKGRDRLRFESECN